MAGNGGEQFGGVGNARLCADREAIPVLAALVQYGEAGVESGAAPRIGASVDDGREHHAGVEAFEGIGPGGIAGDAIGRGNGGQPPANLEHGEGRAQVTQIGVIAHAVDSGRDRKRRVHQDHAGRDIGQTVGDGLGVVPGHRRIREQPGEKSGAPGGEFVQVQGAGGPVPERAPKRALGHHSQHPGTGRGFQHGIARTDRGGLQRRVGQRHRRRELLEFELLFGTPGLGRLQGGERLQHGEHGGGTIGSGACLAAHEAGVTLEEQDQRRLGGLVGVLPYPGALRVGGAEGGAHRPAEVGRIERLSGLQDGQQIRGGAKQRGGLRWGRAVLRCGNIPRHGGDYGRRRGGVWTRGCVRRRQGVGHGDLLLDWEAGPCGGAGR